MQSKEIRERFLSFFEKRGHKIIPSASLVPENDPSVLFNTAGMQPLVPYLLGQEHPMGKRIVDVQKCVRTTDIDEVGDNTHATFFEMMGNWSLGDYFKEEAIKWSYEFLTSKEEGLGLDPKRLYITVFEGDENAPKDEEAFSIWRKYFPENRIYYMGAKSNWWSAGESGPCGPDTEMFYDVTEQGLGDMTKEEYLRADEEQKVVEIWNDVFMEYEKKDGKVIGKLKQRNVDTGAGLERITMVMQNKNNIHETDLFTPVLELFNTEINTENTEVRPMYFEKNKRIIVDHLKAACFLISAGVLPANKDRGYVLRKILRRILFYLNKKSFKIDIFVLIEKISEIYKNVYDLDSKKIFEILQQEKTKFEITLEQGLKEFEKGTNSFILVTTYGFPFELIEELAREKGQILDKKDFDQKMLEHQKLSQTSSAGMFKGGLANHNEKTIRLHTTHHLLLAALQGILGKEVKQRGSNINEERLRIDFLFDRKMTEDEKKQVENLVNQKIGEHLSVARVEMKKEEAEKLGAEMEFGIKYSEIVSVYFIGDKLKPFSLEFCGGPHIKNTSELSIFKILKEEAVTQDIRRIKAVLM
ncbi:MAG: alanine--tRNA ligase [Patescibacteria group bacterium]